MNKLYIVRGLPGSGKSSFVRNSYKMAYEDWFEADMFFESGLTGEYKFNRDLLPHAHTWCFYNVLRTLNADMNCWVSNTFVRLWEMESFLNIGEKLNREIDIEIIEVKTQFYSIHNVPENTIERMKRNWEELTPEMKEKYKVMVIK